MTIISLPVHAAVCPYRSEAELLLLVAVQLLVTASYLPPLLKRLLSPFPPPQMIISLPVQTAVWPVLVAGAFIVVVGVQVFVLGLYFPPVLKVKPMKLTPPQIII